MQRLLPLLGLAVIMGIAYLLSTDRKAIRPKTIFWGLLLQLGFALFVLKSSVGQALFAWVGEEGLAHGALEDEEGEAELQEEAPEDGLGPDRLAVGGEEVGDPHDDGQAEQRQQSLHWRWPSGPVSGSSSLIQDHADEGTGGRGLRGDAHGL